MKKNLPTPKASLSILCFILFQLLFLQAVHADVVVTPAANGSNISADKAANAILPSYTILANILVTENINADLAPGIAQTLILTAPAGWQFNSGTGTVAATIATDISNISISVTATTITVSYDISGVSGLDAISISGIELQAVNGAIVPATGQLYRSLSNPGTAVIATILPTANTNGTGGTNFGFVSQVPGAVAALSFNVQPAGAVVNTIFTQQPVLITQDQFGNNTTNGLSVSQNVSVNLSAGTGILSGTNTLDIGTGSGNGTVSFTDLQIDAAGIKKLMATAGSLASAETNDFTVSKTNTTTLLSSDINPSCINGNVLLTAVITGFSVTGTVEFFDGATSLGISPIVSGSATLSTNALPAGIRSLTAAYSGDTNNNASTSAAYMQTVNQQSANPASATASASVICNGQSSILTLNGGGGGNIETISWYNTSCGTGLIGTGNNLSVSPTTTTIYYGRYEDAAPCNYNSACAQVTITVNQKSADPISATASASTICNGQSSTLTLNGGGGGTGEIIRWYSSSCGVGLVGTGNNLSVSPAATTTYYGRYEDAAPCNFNSACAQVTITVNQKSANPVSANASATTICNGQSSTLTLNGGGTGTGEIIRWYSTSCGTGLVGIGNNLSVSPTVTTTYFGRYEDGAPCNFNSACAQVTITVNQKSADPTSATATQSSICNGGSTTLSLNGGGGGTGPVIKWYTVSCGGTAAGTGNGLVLSPTITTTYYGRYENPAPCNYNTSCANITITVNQRPTGNINSPNTAICKGSSTNITGTVTATGSWTLTLSNGSTATGSGNGTFSISVSPAVSTTYTITGLTDAVCTSIAADRTGSTTVTVRAPVADAGVNQTICAGGSTVIGATTVASGSTGPYSYSWSPSTGLSSATAANPTATPASFPFTYTLVVTDVFGCSSTGSSMTISVGSPVKNWVGSGSIVNSGPDNNFNNPQNWSPGGVPASCNDVVMTLLGSATISLTASATINSLNLNGIGGTDILNVVANALVINNATTVTSTVGVIKIGVNDASSAGVIDFKGDITIGNGVGQGTFIGNTNSRLLFRKNLTMGTLANVATGSSVPGSAEFVGTGAQTITWNTSSLIATSRFNNVIIGDGTNTVTVTLAGSQKVDNILGNLTINNTATLDLNTNQWNRNSSGGTFQMNGTATLKLAAASSAQTGLIFVSLAGVTVAGSNFPGGFTSNNFVSTSTVEYNGSVAQTIYAIPIYGNLTLTNNAIKTAGGPLTAAGNLLINTNATFKANGSSGWTHNIGGNWTNNGSFTYVAGTTNIINFNGNNNASINGSSVTNFYSVTVNKGSSISTILDVLSTATTAVSPATINFNNGLLRIQSTGIFTHNGAGPAITATAGLHVNGGTFNLTDGTTSNNGLIRISSGTANFGTVSGNSVNTATGGIFDLQGGTVNIAGRLVNTAGSLNISGGTMTLAKVGNASATGTFDMSLTTNMNVSSGTVLFQNANSIGNDIIILNSSGTKIFSGGLFQIGNGSTPAANTFKMTSAVPLYNLTVNNTNSPVTRLITTALSLKNNMTILGGVLDAATNNLDITVGGNWVNNGSFLPGTATVGFNGSAVESISGSTNTNFYNLTNSNTSAIVSVNNDISISKQLSLNTGASMNLATGNITLRSDATNTANIGQINTSNAITYGAGKFIVERYIPNHSKAWQFLAVPTSGQTVNQAWQEGNAPLGNTRPGYGTIITSNVAGAVALGFDIYTPVGPTMKTYNPATNGWDGIASPGIAIANPKGYMLFVRGDRSVTAFNQLPTATTLRTTGKLYTPGTDAPAITNVSSGNFESIGNPYASAINFSTVTKTGGVQTDFFYLWDPKLTTTSGPGINSAYGLGGFQTFSWNGSTYNVTPGGGSYTGSNRNIESGQAFLVNAPFSPGTVSFTEGCKVSGSNIVNRPIGILNKQLRTNLQVINNGNNTLIDGNLVEFDESYLNAVDIYDALKLNNTGENLSIFQSDKILAVERKALIENNDTIFYKIGQMKVAQYQFEFIPANMEQPGLIAILEDNYMHTSTVVDLHDTTRFLFTIENITGSYATDRFRLVFKQLHTVPVNFSHISARRNIDKSISIDWKMENETNMKFYTVEKSADGSSFSGIVTADPSLNNGGTATYSRIDESPLTGDNFYRIKALSIDGGIQYSNTVRIAPLQATPSITIYPNPVTGKTFQLQFIGQPAGKYNIVLISGNGTVQLLQNVELISAFQTETVLLPQLIAAGIYRLQITGAEGNKEIKTVQLTSGQ